MQVFLEAEAKLCSDRVLRDISLDARGAVDKAAEYRVGLVQNGRGRPTIAAVEHACGGDSR